MPGPYAWGAKSRARLDTCHPLLILLFDRVIKRSGLRHDLTVVYGVRTKAEQDALVAKGASRLRWPKSRHNATPSLAVDVVPFVGGKPDPKTWAHFHDVAPSIKAEWLRMCVEGVVPDGVTLEWGGDWRGFPDGAHWQLNGIG